MEDKTIGSKRITTYTYIDHFIFRNDVLYYCLKIFFFHFQVKKGHILEIKYLLKTNFLLRNEKYCTVYVYVVIYFCESVVFLSGSQSVQVFNRLFIYVLLFEIHLSLENRFNPATFVCLSQDRAQISNIICRGLFCVQCDQLRSEVIVCFGDIVGIDDHHCLNFLVIT